jgi:hypothetical protein
VDCFVLVVPRGISRRSAFAPRPAFLRQAVLVGRLLRLTDAPVSLARSESVQFPTAKAVKTKQPT